MDEMDVQHCIRVVIFNYITVTIVLVYYVLHYVSVEMARNT